MGTIHRLDNFFRTQLTLDQPNAWNTATNVVFSPVQYLLGQNKYQSLQGKVTEILPPEVSPEARTFLRTLKKAFLCFCAFLGLILTPIGIATRYLSFRSSTVVQAYSIASLLQLPPFEVTPQIIETSFAWLRKKPENERHQLLTNLPLPLTLLFLSYPPHQSQAHAYLLQLDPESRHTLLEQLPTPTQGAFLSTHQDVAMEYLQPLDDGQFNQLLPKLPSELIQKYLDEKSRKEAPQENPDPPAVAAPNFQAATASLAFPNPSEPTPSSSTAASLVEATTAPVSLPVSAETASPAPAPLDRLDFHALQYLLVKICIWQFFYGLFPNESTDELLVKFGQEINANLRQLNRFFRRLLQQEASLKMWVEQESRGGDSFAACGLLTTFFDHEPRIKPHLDAKVVQEWQQLYQRSVLRLKQKGLNSYIKTSFLYDEEYKTHIEEVFANLADARSESAQPESLDSVFQSLLSFFKELDQMTQAHPQDRGRIEGWLKKEMAKPEYNDYFYSANSFSFDPLGSMATPLQGELKTLFQSCCQRLEALGLKSYTKENPSPKTFRSQKIMIFFNKDDYQQKLTRCIAVFKALSDLLRSFSTPPNQESNLRLIEAWWATNTVLPSPFFHAFELQNRLVALKVFFDSSQVDEFSSLHLSCRDQFLALGLEKYVNEIPKEYLTPIPPHGTPPTASAPHLGVAEAGEKASRGHLDAIEAAIASPQDPASLLLGRHLYFYRKIYPSVIEQTIPKELWTSLENTFREKLTEEIPLPTGDELQAVTVFFKTLLQKQAQEGNDQVIAWLDEEKGNAGYTFPFYLALYWHSIARDKSKLKMVPLFYEKIVAWAHSAGQTQRLLEVPRDRSLVFCQLVQAVTERFLQPVQTALPTKPKPFDLRFSLQRHEVDDQTFKTVIGRLVPRIAPLLENERMFQYWKCLILDRVELIMKLWIPVYREVQKGSSKRVIIQYLNTPKMHGETSITVLSKDYVDLFAQLVPLAPPGLPQFWKEEYDKCCAHLRKFEISDNDYINVKAPTFIYEPLDQAKIETLFRDISQFFKDLLADKKGSLETWITLTQDQRKLFAPFWFARELDDICKYYEVRLVAKKVKEFNTLYEDVKSRLRDQGLTRFLDEPAPIPNRELFARQLNTIL